MSRLTHIIMVCGSFLLPLLTVFIKTKNDITHSFGFPMKFLFYHGSEIPLNRFYLFDMVHSSQFRVEFYLLNVIAFYIILKFVYVRFFESEKD